MSARSKHAVKSEFARKIRRETAKLENAQRRPNQRDTKEKRRTVIVLCIGILGLVGGPIARYTVWRRSYEPSIVSQLRLTQNVALPAGLHLLSSN